MKDRLTKYASNSDSIQDIPKELRIAQDTKKWPTEVSEPITLGGKKGLQTTPLKRVMPEDLIDSYPIVDFDVPKHMLDLAIAFDKSAQLKTLIEKRQSEAYRTQNL